MTTASKRRAGAARQAIKGLSDEQRRLVKLHLNGDKAEGWWIFRAPTTINPPTTLRLHRRSQDGKLLQVISITENGVTK